MKFKKIIINFLLEKSFYSVEEFMTIDPITVIISSVLLGVKILYLIDWADLYSSLQG